ncbi:restriction endonuclease [Rhizobium sp.]
MPVPDYQTLMLPVLRHGAKGEQTIGGLLDILADEFALTEEERNMTISAGSQSLLANRAHWAKTYLVKAGLLVQPRRGHFVASKRGLEVLGTNPSRIDKTTLAGEGAFDDFIGREEVSRNTSPNAPIAPAKLPTAVPDKTRDDVLDDITQDMRTTLTEAIISRIMANSPAFFERLVIDLLVAMGYGGSHEDAARSLGRSGDGGIDGCVDGDRLGINQIYVQAKRYNPENGVGRPAMQGFVGSLIGQRATIGVFITTSYFSSNVAEYLRSIPQRIITIDGRRLVQFMLEYKIGVKIIRTVEILDVDDDAFIDEG